MEEEELDTGLVNLSTMGLYDALDTGVSLALAPFGPPEQEEEV
jgi:hypothetical protein